MSNIITAKVESWTPADATAAKATQKRNRNISKGAVARYRADMESGRFVLNGEAIKFDADGHLIDGGHRTEALSGATPGTVVEFLVVRGLSTDAQLSMDQGHVRKTGQQLGMLGIKSANNVAAGVRFYLVLKSGVMFRDNKLAAQVITKSLVEGWVLEHPAIIEALNPFIGNMCAADAPPTVSYCAALLFHEKNPAATVEFFSTMAHGGAPADHPITVLDKRLQRHRREGLKISNRDMLGLYVQAWNAWRKGGKLTRFQLPRGGHWTEATFPKPVA